mmetsp:Transcript_5064/g.18079  ORF Transcript_5064/g.18079 Transcript_5064/m.18079 type:complete len:241 (+) Transcript_5064:840-1562(+)
MHAVLRRESMRASARGDATLEHRPIVRGAFQRVRRDQRARRQLLVIAEEDQVLRSKVQKQRGGALRRAPALVHDHRVHAQRRLDVLFPLSQQSARARDRAEDELAVVHERALHRLRRGDRRRGLEPAERRGGNRAHARVRLRLRVQEMPPRRRADAAGRADDEHLGVARFQFLRDGLHCDVAAARDKDPLALRHPLRHDVVYRRALPRPRRALDLLERGGQRADRVLLRRVRLRRAFAGD